jgi:RHS repeat-associated protein
MYRHASGLYLTHYRFYDPEAGRWLNRDPIGEHGGTNLYAYVGGNPVNYVDPTGEFAIALPLLNPATWAALGKAAAYVGSAAFAAWVGNEIIDYYKSKSIDQDSARDDRSGASSRSIPAPSRPKCGCTCICRADANLNDPKNTEAFAFGTATEHDCEKASKTAKRIATKALGQQPKHVGCRCTNS